MMVQLGLVQDCPGRDLADTLKKLRLHARTAAREGCEAVCFPECFLTGYDPDRARELSLDKAGPALQQVEALAREHQLDLLVGFMERGEGRFYITQGLFRRDGTREYYRKTHLGRREAFVFTPGDRLEVFSLSCGLKVGVQLCVEAHYPEIAQTLALLGAEAVFAPHASPRVSGDREKIWGKYIPARSYDNRLYMLCCNLRDETRFAGGCLVTDPNGETIQACFGDAPLLIARIDREQVARYRLRDGKPSRHFFPGSRRPELYRP